MEDYEDDPTIPECVDSLRRSSRSDWIAFATGVATFPLGFWVQHRLSPSFPPGIIASLTLLGLSFSAALLSANRPLRTDIPLRFMPASCIRWGARTGLIVFLVGSGFFLLGITARQVANGLASGSFSKASPAFPPGLGVFLIFLPTLVAGAVGASLGSGQFASRAATSLAPNPPPQKRFKGSKGALPMAVALFTFSFISPVVPAFFGSREISSTVQPFGYEAPAELAAAPASKWHVVESRLVPGLHLGSVAAQSVSGHYLAFASGANGGVTVFNLRNNKVDHAFSTPPIASIAWSPTDDRIFCVGSADASCWVLNRANGALVALPVRGRLPNGFPRWKSASEILFEQGTAQAGRLDLETLRSRTFTASETGEFDSFRHPLNSLAETEKCRVAIRPRVHSLGCPVETGTGEWSFDASAALCVTDKATSQVVPLLTQRIEPGATLLTAPDASMVTIITSHGAITYYLGISENAPPDTFQVELPRLPDHPSDSRLAKLTESGRVGTFICAPLSNPLNGKVIGPDPRQVRALAFLSGWGEESDKLTIAEAYSTVQPGDVAGYLHHWRGGQVSLLTGSKLEEWWGAAGSPTTLDAGAISASLPWNDPDLYITQTGIQFRGWREGQSDGLHPPLTDIRKLAVGEPKPPPAPESTPPILRSSDPPPQPKAEKEPDPITQVIRRFATNHHEKVAAGDLDGFVSDYANLVDLNDKGQVTSEFIREDQAAYLTKYQNLSEKIVGPIDVQAVKGGYRASYQILSHAVSKRDGKEHNNKVSITLDIYHHHGGVFEIFRERAAPAN